MLLLLLLLNAQRTKMTCAFDRSSEGVTDATTGDRGLSLERVYVRVVCVIILYVSFLPHVVRPFPSSKPMMETRTNRPSS